MNRRWEETTHYGTFQTPDGQTFQVPVSSQGCTVDDEICSKCGAIYHVRGVTGGLKEIMFGKVCPACTPAPSDSYE
jgi:hypothetical protein